MTQHKFSILLIEENPREAAIILKMLKPALDVTHINRPLETYPTHYQRDFDLIILDLSSFSSNSLTIFSNLQSQFDPCPILVLAEAKDESRALEAVKQGAQDYLLLNEVKGKGLANAILHVIERHHLQASLRTLSFTDELTGLYNRRGFTQLAEQQMDLARRSKTGFYLLRAKLDNCDKIKASHGQDQGNTALVQTGNCLKSALRRSDIISRWSSDEFAAILIHSTKESAPNIKNQIYQAINRFNAGNRASFDLCFSMGMTYFDPHEIIDLDDLLHRAKEALSTYQKNGKLDPRS